MSETIDDARQLITSRLAELDAEARQLERTLAVLRERGDARGRRPARARRTTPATATPTHPKAKARSRKAKREGRAPRGLRREELLAAIKATPGARPAELAAAIDIRPTQVHALIAKARGEKLIVKRGQGYALKS